MHAKTHARLMKILFWTILVGTIPLSILWCAWIGRNTTVALVLVVGISLILILFYLILLALPVRCEVPGRNGLMEKSITQVSDWAPIIKSKLEYRCTVCGLAYEAYVFHLPQGDGIP
jgi:hypothetical protein